MPLHRADDLTLVAMRKPGAKLTWDDVHWKGGPDYHNVPQCVFTHDLVLHLSDHHTHALKAGNLCAVSFGFVHLVGSIPCNVIWPQGPPARPPEQ